MDKPNDFERLSRLMLDEFKRVHERFDEMTIEIGSIASEVADIHRRLDALEHAVGNVTGFSKEIDHLLVRVSAIERHLGLTGYFKA